MESPARFFIHSFVKQLFDLSSGHCVCMENTVVNKTDLVIVLMELTIIGEIEL